MREADGSWWSWGACQGHPVPSRQREATTAGVRVRPAACPAGGWGLWTWCKSWEARRRTLLSLQMPQGDADGGGGFWLQFPLAKAPRHLRGSQEWGTKEPSSLLLVPAAHPQEASMLALLPPSSASQRCQGTRRSKASWQLASEAKARPAGHICSSLPAACLWEAGRQPMQVAECQPPECSADCGKLARLTRVPICQPVPDECARASGPRDLGGASPPGVQALEVLALSPPSLSPILLLKSEMLSKGPKGRYGKPRQQGMDG